MNLVLPTTKHYLIDYMRIYRVFGNNLKRLLAVKMKLWSLYGSSSNLWRQTVVLDVDRSGAIDPDHSEKVCDAVNVALKAF